MIIIVTGRGVNTTGAVASIPGVCAHILSLVTQTKTRTCVLSLVTQTKTRTCVLSLVTQTKKCARVLGLVNLGPGFLNDSFGCALPRIV